MLRASRSRRSDPEPASSSESSIDPLGFGDVSIADAPSPPVPSATSGARMIDRTLHSQRRDLARVHGGPAFGDWGDSGAPEGWVGVTGFVRKQARALPVTARRSLSVCERSSRPADRCFAPAAIGSSCADLAADCCFDDAPPRWTACWWSGRARLSKHLRRGRCSCACPRSRRRPGVRIEPRRRVARPGDAVVRRDPRDRWLSSLGVEPRSELPVVCQAAGCAERTILRSPAVTTTRPARLPETWQSDHATSRGRTIARSPMHSRAEWWVAGGCDRPRGCTFRAFRDSRAGRLNGSCYSDGP